MQQARQLNTGSGGTGHGVTAIDEEHVDQYLREDVKYDCLTMILASVQHSCLHRFHREYELVLGHHRPIV